MNEDPFLNPSDWFHANKHRMPASFDVGTYSFLEYVFKWKEIELVMVPLLKKYIYKYYPEVVSNPAFALDVNKACEHCAMVLTEIIFKTIKHSAQGASLQQTYPGTYPLLKKIIGIFKLTGLIITPDNYPDWLLMINDEEERAAEIAAHNANTQKGIDKRREFIDITQPVMLKALPGIPDIEGDWWLNYEYAYAHCFNLVFDWMNRVSYNGPLFAAALAKHHQPLAAEA